MTDALDDLMDNNNDPEKRRPTQVSSASSLDSFLMELPAASEFGLQTLVSEPILENEADTIVEKGEVGGTSEEAAEQTATAAHIPLAPRNGASGEPQSSSTSNTIGQLPTQIQQTNESSLVDTSNTIALNNSIPEFLYQLTKMLTDDNWDVIEWSNGRIEVHSPHKLESHVLKKYFRHSKFASFQRQLNYFGFRKLAGKGKMAPCSYVNEAAGEDIGSLLLIKRKSGPMTTTKDAAQGNKKASSSVSKSRKDGVIDTQVVNPILAGIFNRSTARTESETSSGRVKPRSVSMNAVTAVNNITTNETTIPKGPVSAQQALARTAVGRGIRHKFMAAPLQPAPVAATVASLPSLEPSTTAPPPRATRTSSLPVSSSTTASLSALADNYRNSLANSADDGNPPSAEPLDTDPTPLSQMQGLAYDSTGTFAGFLSRNSSLVDLAMIAPVETEVAVNNTATATTATKDFGFVDFPNPEVDPSGKP